VGGQRGGGEVVHVDWLMQVTKRTLVADLQSNYRAARICDDALSANLG
jgi:hypothetical protein